jgi:fructose-1,6-bisphosphatase I
LERSTYKPGFRDPTVDAEETALSLYSKLQIGGELLGAGLSIRRDEETAHYCQRKKMRSFVLSAILLIAGVHAWTCPSVPFPRVSTTTGTSTQLASTKIDKQYYTFMEAPVQTQSGTAARITLTRYLDDQVKADPSLRDLESLLLAIQMGCKTISHLVHRAGLVYSITREQNEQEKSKDDTYKDGRFYSMKRLDQLSTIVLKNALKYTGKCETVAPVPKQDSESPAQHQPGVLIARALDSNYVACLDPLDGSGNADASICTGTIFGVFEQPDNDKGRDEEEQTNHAKSGDERAQELIDSVLQPGKNMRAAGYCLYSSATVLVFTLGDTVQGFTLDPQINEFVLTHPDLTIPRRGTVYSCNEGNSEGWDESYKEYLRNLKTGKGETGQRYAHRYVGSMVGDIHRTLLYGGIFAYPADTQAHPEGNLQLLYKISPLSFVVAHAGGRAIDGRTGSLLDVRPERVHQKSPCFLGSPEDVAELESYLLKSLSKVIQ